MPVNPLFSSAILVNSTITSNQVTAAPSNLFSTQARPTRAVAMAADGSFAIAWSSQGQGETTSANWGAYIRFFNADGTAASDEILVDPVKTRNQSTASIALMSDGNYLVTWTDDDTAAPALDESLNGVYGRVFSPTGSPVGNEFLINEKIGGGQYNSSIATSANGTFVVTWGTNAATGDAGDGIRARIFNNNGTPASNEFGVNTFKTGDQIKSAVAMADDGSFVVVWESIGQDGAGAGIYGQRYDANGDVRGGEFQISQTTLRDQETASVAMAGDGSFVVTWTSDDGSSGGGNEVYARRYDALGAAVGGEFRVSSFGQTSGIVGDQRDSMVTMTAGGGFIITWTSGGVNIDNLDLSGTGVYAQRFNNLGLAIDGVFLVNKGDSSVTDGDQYNPSIATNASGDFIVAWTSKPDLNGDNVYAQGFTIPLNQSPVLTPPTGLVGYSENQGAVVLDSTIAASDIDSPDLVSATVSIGNYVAGEDTLTATNLNGIAASFDSGTGVLTLSGLASPENYQLALQSVAYTNSSQNPTTTDRPITIALSDGVTSATVTRTIIITASNDVPSIGVTASPLVFPEDGIDPVAIDDLISITDPDSPTLTGATVTITNFVPSEDTIFFTNQGTISGELVGGVLTLSGTATREQYQAALRSVGFKSTGNPTTPSTERSASFVVNDGIEDSPVKSRTIQISAVDDPPSVATTGQLIYLEKTGAQTIVPTTLTVTDVDSLTLTGATVTIANFIAAEDELSFINGSGIAGIWDSGTGVLTLSGTATLADYQAALRSVKYTNTSLNPTAGDRTVQFTVNDGTSNSAVEDYVVRVTLVNDPPVVIPTVANLNYAENDGVVSIDDGLRLNDPDSTILKGATVTITGVVAGEDTFAFTSPNSIAGTVVVTDATTITVTLTGDASIADYQAALRAITYINNSTTPTETPRRLSFIVTDDTNVTSAAEERLITVRNTLNAPFITTTPGAIAYDENDGAVIIDAGVAVSDIDSDDFASATVTIGGYVTGQDALTFIDQPDITKAVDSVTGNVTFTFTAQPNITAVFSPLTGILTLTGVASKADYQAVLSSVAYINSSADPTGATRTIRFQANDGVSDGNTAFRPLQITGVNNPPEVTLAASSFIYTENAGAVFVDGLLTVKDLDNLTLNRALVILEGYVDGEDILSFVAAPGIAGLFDAATGRIAFTGQVTSTVADFETTLRSLKYTNTSSNPTPGTRTVKITVNDGIIDSDVKSRSIDVRANTPSVVAPTLAPLNYSDNQGAVAIDDGLTVTDIDSPILSSATVTIEGFVAGEDVLALTSPPVGMTSSFDAVTGVLTLSGPFAIGIYQDVLRAVTYTNTNPVPATTPRTLLFQVNDGIEDSNVGRRTLQIVVNAAPTISTTTTTLPYTENQGAIALTSGLTVGDTDSPNLVSATVTLVGYVAGEDTLAFGTLPAGITGSFNTATGVIEFMGSGTLTAYSTLLASLTYTNSSSNPTTTPRTLQIKVNDGIEDSATANRSIQIAANVAPTVTLAGDTLVYEEGQGAIGVDPTLLVNDTDSPNLTGATVTIGSYVATEDLLSFTAQLGITGSFNTTTGVLTLTGTTTFGNYQTVLRTVTYTNNSSNPTGTTRSIDFQVSDGIEGSDPTSRTIQVNTVDSPPSGSGTGTPLTYNEGTGAVPIDPGITLNDPDSPNLTGATITITGFVPGQDVLTFVAQPPISGTFNPATGVLTLSGTATVAQYQAAIQSITYTNTSSNPATTPRQIEITVTDGNTTSAPPIVRPIVITPVNTAPSVNTTSGNLLYNEGAGALAIDTGIAVSDPDSATLTGATVTLTGFVAGQDTLSFTTQNGISGSLVGGVLTLTGSSSVANYQTALRSITYTNSSLNPDASPRTLNISVTDGTATSNVATRSIQLTVVNNAPVVTSGGTLAYAENAGAVAIDAGITVTDADSATLSSATIAISGYVLGQDSLSFTTQNGISGAFDPTTGVLSLTGSSSVANYQAALRSITYTNSSPTPTTTPRTLRIVVNDGTVTSAPADRGIQISSIDTPPVLTLSTSALAYAENAGAVVVDGTIVISDLDSTTLTGARITINGYVNGEDLLSFNNQGGISGSFNATTGVLTLSGSAPLTSYQVALRSITYSNVSSNPSPASRAIQFVVNDGTSLSAPSSRVIQISQFNSPPVVATSSTPLSYVEGAGAVAIDPGIFVLDIDSATLTGATVTLSGYIAGQDNLLFSNQNGISSSFNVSTGVLTLTGAAAIASYQDALRSIVYLNSSSSPVTTNRSAQFTVTDVTASSNLAVRAIQVTAVNTPPVVTLPPQALTFSRSLGAIAVAPALIASDPDSPDLTGATITLGGYVAGQDSLVFADQNGISGSFNAVTGTLALTGTATVALYQAALRSLIYSNNSETPATNPRTISISVTDGTTRSNTATAQIQFESRLSVPVLDLNGSGSFGIDFSSTFVISGAPVAIAASDARLTGQNGTIASAQVRISNLLDGNAEELLADTTGTGIAASYSQGTLTLSGAASLDSYLQVLRTVQYQNRLDNPDRATRVILFSVSDGVTTSEPAQTTVQITQVNLNALVTTPATDVIYAPGSDNKVISLLENLQQNDTIDGGAGMDTFVLTNGTGDAVVDVANSTNQVSGILTGITTIRNFELFDFSGFAGNVTMFGSDRLNDDLMGGMGNDQIYGKAGNDRLVGNAGNDLLDGGAGNDTMIGGAGDDTYVVDSVGDTIVEAADNGFDTVQSSLSQIKLGENLEDLVLISNAGSGTGNNLSNNLTGNGLGNTLIGGGGDDFITGSGGKDSLLGDMGDDRLDGGAGKDQLVGGSGDDMLIGGQGKDRLVGGSGDDMLIGGQGKDRLKGGQGKDTFALDSAKRSSRDTITDFRVADDRIVVARAGFSTDLREGTIAPSEFALGSRSQDSSDRFIYDQNSGNLYFDADGTGAAAQVWVARLSNRAAIGSSNIGVAI
jgi:large repetitive protein